jgi:Inositol hexakisphosphate
VIPVWEEVRPGDVAVMKDVMAACKESCDDIDVFYRRVPLTSERPPDFSDFSELISVMLSPNMVHTPIVVNDQLGRGRSTLTSVSLTWTKTCKRACSLLIYSRLSLFSFNSGLQAQGSRPVAHEPEIVGPRL